MSYQGNYKLSGSQSTSSLSNQYGLVLSPQKPRIEVSNENGRQSNYSYVISQPEDNFYIKERSSVRPQDDTNTLTVTTITTTQGEAQRLANQYKLTNQNFGYAYSNPSNSRKPSQNELDDLVKRSKKTQGNGNDSSDSSDNENKVVSELKYNKKKWNQAYILFAKSIIEQQNEKISSMETRILSLVKAADMKDQQIYVEINKLRTSSTGSTTINIQNSQEYVYLQSEFASLRTKSNDLELNNQKLAQLVSANDEDKQKLLSQIALLTTQLEAAQSNKQVSQQFVLLQQDFNSLRLKCEELEVDNQKLAHMVFGKDEEKVQLLCQIVLMSAQLEAQQQNQNSEITRLKQQIEQLSRSSETIFKLERENNNLQNEINQLNIKIQQYFVQIQQQSKEIQQYTVQIQQLNIQIQEYNGDQAHIKMLEQKIREYDAQVNRLQEELKQLIALRQKHEQLETQFKAMIVELQKRELEVQEYRQRCAKLEGEINIFRERQPQIDQFKRTIREYEEKIIIIQTQLGDQIKIKDAEILELRHRYSKLEGEITIFVQMQGEYELLKKTIRELEEKLIFVQNQSIKEIRIRDEEIQDLRKKVAKHENECGNEIRLREVEIQELRQKCSKLQEQLTIYIEKSGESEQLRRALRELEERLIQIQNQSRNEIRIKDTEIQELQQRVTQLSNELNLLRQRVGENEQLRITLREYEQKLIIIENNSGVKESEVIELRQRLAQLQGEVTLLRQKSGENEQLIRTLREYEQRIIVIQNQGGNDIRVKDAEIQELKQRLILLQGELSSLREKSGDSQKLMITIREYEERLILIQNQTGNEIRIKDSELYELRQRCAKLQSELNVYIERQGESEQLKRTVREYEDRLILVQSQGGNDTRMKDLQIQELSQRINSIEGELSLYAQQNDSLKITLLEYEEKLKQLENQLANSNQIKEYEMDELRKRSAKNDRQTAQSQANIMELEQLRLTLREYEERIKFLEQSQQQNNNSAQFEQFNLEIYNLSSQLKIQNQDATDLRQRCEMLQNQLKESETKYNQLIRKYEESEYNNKIIVDENSRLIMRMKDMEYQLTQVSAYETQINEIRQSYFDILTQFTLVCSVLESQSDHHNQSTTVVVNNQQELLSLQSEVQMLRQNNFDLSTRCSNLQSQLDSKIAELNKMLGQQGDFERQNKIIIEENNKLILKLQEKDSLILRLQSQESQNSASLTQITNLQLEVKTWMNKFESSKQDILLICQETERLKAQVAEKEREISYLRLNQNSNLQKANELATLEGECSRLRISLQQKDDELFQLRRNGVQQASDNSQLLIMQINSREQELEETKKRFSIYVQKNAELSAEVEMLKTRKYSADVVDYSIGSNSDKDQLLYRYRVENKRLQTELEDLQNYVKLNQNELRQVKGKGCSSGCA